MPDPDAALLTSPDTERWSHLTWSPWRESDLPAISALLTAVEDADRPGERHSLAELTEDLQERPERTARDCRVARDADGVVVAIARSHCHDEDSEVRRCVLAGAVHPRLRGRGLGTAILDWQIGHAQAWDRLHREPGHGPLRLDLYADAANDAEQSLAQRHGLTRAGYLAELTRPFTEAERHGEPPAGVAGALEGISIDPWHGADPAETLAVRNATFADHPGSVARGLDGWLHQQRGVAFRPEWSFVARDDGRVIGFVMAAAYEQDWQPQGYTSGYIELLGTLAPYRGRGVATALIGASLSRFAADGMEAGEIGVNVENPSGALGLYGALGFTETSATVHLSHTCR